MTVRGLVNNVLIGGNLCFKSKGILLRRKDIKSTYNRSVQFRGRNFFKSHVQIKIVRIVYELFPVTNCSIYGFSIYLYVKIGNVDSRRNKRNGKLQGLSFRRGYVIDGFFCHLASVWIETVQSVCDFAPLNRISRRAI